ncbi:MAG: SDR family NAD(P)-dependent oxidoreductase [Streptosporangiales bacterium]|nr:SDR family NAD(P)-dependent oxidoreductase [Streptosporangiales bacterium]
MDAVEGQVALVTGASRGIGRAIAESLAAAGMRVALLARDPARLAEVAAACDPSGERVHWAAADATDVGAVHEFVAAVEERFGRIDLLVNNAGQIESAERPLWEIDPDEWWRVVEVNLRGPAAFLHAVAPGMVRRSSGRIVNLASGLGSRRVPEYSAYAASKGALMRVTDSVAEPLRAAGVAIFDVSPGLVRTDMTAGMAMWQDHPADKYFPVSNVCDLIREIATGRLDALTGRYFHAGHDTADALLAQTTPITAGDARALRIRPYGPTDPAT